MRKYVSSILFILLISVASAAMRPGFPSTANRRQSNRQQPSFAEADSGYDSFLDPNVFPLRNSPDEYDRVEYVDHYSDARMQNDYAEANTNVMHVFEEARKKRIMRMGKELNATEASPPLPPRRNQSGDRTDIEMVTETVQRSFLSIFGLRSMLLNAITPCEATKRKLNTYTFNVSMSLGVVLGLYLALALELGYRSTAIVVIICCAAFWKVWTNYLRFPTARLLIR